MKKNYGKLIAVFAAVSVIFGTGCVSFAASDKNDTVSLEFKDIDVSAAIESLFRNTGKNFTIEPDVSGVIPSLSFKDVPFDTALKNLLKTAGLTYRQDGSIYLISKKPAASAITPQVPDATTTTVDEPEDSESTIEKIPLSNMGATDLLNIMNGNTNSQSGYGGMSSLFGSSGSSFGSSGSSFGSSGSSFGSSSFGNSGSSFGSSSFGSSRSW